MERNEQSRPRRETARQKDVAGDTEVNPLDTPVGVSKSPNLKREGLMKSSALGDYAGIKGLGY